MSKHTPGPWKYWHEKGYVGELNSPNGNLIAGFESEPSEADARLIAAAPELLAAIADMEAQGEWHGTTWAVPAGVWRAARAAIAKATGAAA